ncbi:GTP 3',8-cyclase MoaA [Micromonospora sp. NBRC 107095]|uniref:GTP 3',8-cyclase MoaA n=1 Tax=Micromonospora sp. NBRC 107095 TaxID=3032209 RepID=UPI0024A2DFAA|nr:GTP 3',8-cyclase MoaA [Micromonospora sp. NBRC 107095]GLZ60908.1 GTP 3',8-cyclase 1 [Micromonospora sp. NBRC 107095]
MNNEVAEQGPLVTAHDVPGGPRFARQPRDVYDRPLEDLRLSVTDRCNLRCAYCMPEEEYAWLSRGNFLSFDEIVRVVDAFLQLGVRKVRLTGGEPLLRGGLPELVAQLASRSELREIAMTTNGILLTKYAKALKAAGLSRVTVSLDTLRSDRFSRLTRRTSHTDVLTGIRSLADAGFTGTKLDTVVVRGFNEDELADLIEFGRTVAAEVRFIEYMDVGGATHWSREKVFTRPEMLASLSRHFGPVEPVAGRGTAPAERFELPDGHTFGIISSTTRPFCSTCNRSRLTADGMWYRCLYALGGADLRTPLRDGASIQELADLINGLWKARRDQGAVDRLQHRERGALVGVDALTSDPHLEMHTRGG